MRLTRLRVENFRSIKQIEIELGETTVFIGPNDAGKTSILDAIRIVMTRRWGQRGTGFTEYDIHLATEADDPKTSAGVKIEARAEEIVAGEWPDEIQQDLNDIIQLDPTSEKHSVTLSASCAWNTAEGAFIWQNWRCRLRQTRRNTRKLLPHCWMLFPGGPQALRMNLI